MRLIGLAKYAIGASALILLAGCGIQQVQPSGPTAVPTTPPQPTATPIPTLAVTGGSVAANINGMPVAMSLFTSLLNSTYRSGISSGSPVSKSAAEKSALGQLIEEVVILQTATREHIVATSSDIQKQINAFIAQSGSKAAFEASLKTQGLTQSDLKFIAKVGVVQGKLLKKIVPKVTSGPIATARQIFVAAKKPLSKAEALFTANVTPTADRCEHKMLTYASAKQEAEKFQHELQSGTPFKKLASKCSDDARSAATGGVLTGPLNTAALFPYVEGFAPQWETAVFKGPVAAYQLVGSIDGWHIIQVTKRSHAKYKQNVASQTGATTPVSTLVQEYHFQSWLTAQAEKAYGHTTVFAKIG